MAISCSDREQQCREQTLIGLNSPTSRHPWGRRPWPPAIQLPKRDWCTGLGDHEQVQSIFILYQHQWPFFEAHHSPPIGYFRQQKPPELLRPFKRSIVLLQRKVELLSWWVLGTCRTNWNLQRGAPGKHCMGSEGENCVQHYQHNNQQPQPHQGYNQTIRYGV